MSKKKPNYWWNNAIRSAELLPAESANELQRFVINFCNQHLNWEVWRNNTGRKGGISFGYKGSGDVIGMTDKGVFVSIEVKYDKDKPSEEQLSFRSRVLSRKGWGVMIKTKVEFLQEVKSYLDSIS